MGDPSSDPTTTPTTTATSETSGTSGPAPECQSDADCDGFCEYCVDGECYDAVGCCGLVPGAQGELELRCQGYECYVDEDCGDGESCEGSWGECVSMEAIPVCVREPLVLSAIPLQGEASALALADVDGDAALDLVAVLANEGLVEVMLGDGMGGFAAGAVFPSGLVGPGQRLAIADFDANGSADLALTIPKEVGELSLLFGQDAVFAAPVKDSIGHVPQRIWAGDFDGDGTADLLTHDEWPEQPITLRLGAGMGTFGPEIGAAALAGQSFAAAVGRLSGADERLDVAATITSQPGADVFEFTVQLKFDPVAMLTAPGDAPLTSLTIGDVDGDGLADLVGHRVPDGLQLIQVWSQQVPLPDLRVDGPVRLGPVADVDGDGKGDLVTASSGSVRVIYLGREVECVAPQFLGGETAPELLAAGDLDGDGKAEIVAGAVGSAGATLVRAGP